MQSKSASKDDPQVAVLLRAGLGQRPDPVMSFGYPIGEAKTQEFGSFSAAFPDISKESEYVDLVWDASKAGYSLAVCTMTLDSQDNFHVQSWLKLSDAALAVLHRLS